MARHGLNGQPRSGHDPIMQENDCIICRDGKRGSEHASSRCPLAREIGQQQLTQAQTVVKALTRSYFDKRV